MIAFGGEGRASGIEIHKAGQKGVLARYPWY